MMSIFSWASNSVEGLFGPLWRNLNDNQQKNVRVVCGLLIGGYLTNQIAKKTILFKQRYDTKKKIKAKQEECKLSKEKLSEFLQEREISKEVQERIIKLSFNDLMKELQSGNLTAVDVLHAYQLKALEVDERLNCITEIVWEAEAIATDRDLNADKKGPLYGIPVSIKETYLMPGYASTGGMAYYLDQSAAEENVLITVLKKQGAVPFVRTNVPQTLMTFECSNSIYGTTGNPYDPSRIPGGSSGGEAALIGGGGSILGMGGDIGGSLRIPAHMCGICALKPTGGRLSRKGQNKFNRGQSLVRSQTGPMAADVDTLVTCMRHLLVPELFRLDPSVPPIPFRDEIYKDQKKLTIGFYIDDGNLKSAPACQRAVLEVKAILEAHGHTLVPFKPVDIFRMVTLFLKSVFADGGQSYADVLETDIIYPGQTQALRTFFFPKWFRKFIGYVGKIISKDHFVKVLMHSGCGVKSISEYWDLAVEIERYKSDYLKKWRDNKLDAVICPGFAYPAIPSGNVTKVAGGVTYTNLYNLLDYPAGTVKITNVTQQDVDNFKHFPSNTWMEKYMKKFSEGSVGLPVGVQFVSLPYQEELVLRLMKEVEYNIKTKQ